MARNGMFSRRRRNDFSPVESHEVHVLAVDDSLVDRKVIERLLKITSCKVTAVDSGWRALQFLGLDGEKSSAVGFNGLKVDMIITDYCMPGMTGYELLKRIKGSSTFREVPVVIMSSENVVARIDRCLEEGAEDFIVKPVQLSDVKRLKDYMFGENQLEVEDRGVNKRKLQEMSGLSFYPPPATISPAISPPLPSSFSSSPSPPPASFSPFPSPPPSLSTSPSPPPSFSASPSPPSSFSASPSPPPSLSTSPSPPPSLSASPSPPLASSPSPSPISISPSPSPLSISPSLTPTSSPSTPCSPTLLNSPTLRLTVTNCD